MMRRTLMIQDVSKYSEWVAMGFTDERMNPLDLDNNRLFP